MQRSCRKAKEADVENMPWVMCDECKFWMHIDCIPFGVDTSQIDNREKLFCHDCPNISLSYFLVILQGKKIAILFPPVKVVFNLPPIYTLHV